MLPLLAWKNIWRNRTRSLVVLGSVVLGIWVGTFMMAYAFGVIDQRLKDAVSDEISHFQGHHPNFSRDFEVKYLVENAEELIHELDVDANVAAASSRVVTHGVVASSKTSSGAKISGVDPVREQEVTKLADKVKDGTYFSDAKNRTIIGKKLADKLGVKLRSKIVLTFQDANGDIASGAFRVAGIYETYNSGYDEINIFVKDKDLQDLLAVPNSYHEIAVLLNNVDSMEILLAHYRDKYNAILFEDWREIAPELGLMVDSFDQYMIIFLVIILLAISFGIINTMLMAVLERVREIGMLMAIGMNKPRLFGLIAIETIYLVIISAPIGMLLAYLTIQYTGATGIDLSSLYDESYASFGIKTIIYPKLIASYYWRILSLVVATAILASIYPAWTAIRLDPVQAMRKI